MHAWLCRSPSAKFPIAFAMLRSAHAALGTELLVNAEGEQSHAEIVPLRFVDPGFANPAPGTAS